MTGLDTGVGSLAFDYDAAGRLTSTGFADARLSITRDAAGRPITLTLRVGSESHETAAMSRSWTYRPDNTQVEVTDSLRGARRFGADAMGRVTSAVATT